MFELYLMDGLKNYDIQSNQHEQFLSKECTIIQRRITTTGPEPPMQEINMTDEIKDGMGDGNDPSAMKEIQGRKILFGGLCGSYNYNLNEEGSDKDYHLYLLPTIDDIYKGNTYSKSEVTEILDYASWDLRRLPEMMWKANPNVIEVLYSSQRFINDVKFIPLVEKLFSMRDDIASMNLPYMWKASYGIIHSEIKDLDRRDPDLIQEFGYNTKVAMHALRTMRTVAKYAVGDFKGACRCDERSRAELLRVKHGGVYKDLEEARDDLQRRLELMKSQYEAYFMEKEPVRETYEKVEDICRSITMEHLRTILREWC